MCGDYKNAIGSVVPCLRVEIEEDEDVELVEQRSSRC